MSTTPASTIAALQQELAASREHCARLQAELDHTQSILRQPPSLQQLVSHVACPVTLTTPDGKIVCANHFAEQELGLQDWGDDHVAAFWESTAEHAQFFQQLQRDGSVYRYPAQLRRPDHSTLHTLLSAQMVTHDEQPLIVLVLQNIEEHHQAELARQRLRQMLEQAHIGLLVVEVKTAQIVEANSSCVAELGFSRAELLSLKAADLWQQVQLEPDLLQEYQRQCEEPHRAAIAAAETRLHRPDGTALWVRLSLSQQHVDQSRYLLVTLQNVTRHRDAEDRLYESETLFASAFQGAFHGMAILNRDSQVERVNQALLSMFGYTEAELLGSFVDTLVDPSFHEIARAARQQIWSGAHHVEGERIYLTKQGTPMPVLTALSPILGADGKVASILLQTMDTGKIKLAQEQALQAAKLASVGEVAASIAHELRNPLAGIKTVLEVSLALQNFAPAQIENDYEKVLEMVDRCEQIINHVREYTRNSNNDQKVPVSLNDVIHSTFLLVSKSLQQHGIEIHHALEAELPPVLGNAVQLEQVLANLINNARDAMEGRPERKLTIHTFSQRDRVCVEVEDTGAGVPEHIQERIFESFFTTKPQGKGTGLGMSISSSILKEHHGQLLLLRTSENAGAVFRVELPLLPPTTS
jgi:PAS domain S-box-containing protein